MKISPISFGQTFINSTFQNLSQDNKDKLGPAVAIGEYYPMDIFIGARMHATIAAFSAGVITIPTGYSRKFKGLYDSIEYPYVIDLQNMTTSEAIEKTLEYIENSYMLEKQIMESKMLIDLKNGKNKELFTEILLDIIKKK